MGKIDPEALMYRLDNYRPLPDGTIEGKRLHKVAYQLERQKRYLGLKKRIKNIIYTIDGEHMVVYANKEKAIIVMKMGLSLKRLRRYTHSRKRIMHPNCVTAEEYYRIFTNPYTNANQRWLKRNKYQICS